MLTDSDAIELLVFRMHRVNLDEFVQKLSFATYGNEKQSKLIWRNQNSPGVGCGFRKRYREEGT